MCLPIVKTSARSGPAAGMVHDFWKKGGSQNKVACHIERDKSTECPLFLKFRSINNVGLHFHIHVEILRHGRNVFPCSPETLRHKLCFPFTFGRIVQVITETTFLEVVCSSEMMWFPFNTFWFGGEEER